MNEEWTSKVVKRCQVCANEDLRSVLFIGYLPPVNQMRPIGERPREQPSYPAEVLYCPKCHLAQLGLIVNPKILFPKEYPYTSSTTRILRENFAELYKEATGLVSIGKDDLVIDIGSNDGNLLSNFKEGHRVLGITPEDIGKLAIERGIPTILDYFTPSVVDKVKEKHGKAKIVTATNVFAHIDDVNGIVSQIIEVMKEDGVFISESHYLLRLIETLQYDTIYHEHLRYYSLHTLRFLLERHGLEIFHVKEIPTHGGSIRVYAAKKGLYTPDETVEKQLELERGKVTSESDLLTFRDRTVLSKLKLLTLLKDIKEDGGRIYGIGAPSRASTLVNYVGIDTGIMDAVMEIKGSHKVNKYMPGTLIPVLDEGKLYEDQPDYAVLLSWHIADELAPKLKEKGFKGKFIVPLPEPRILEV